MVMMSNQIMDSECGTSGLVLMKLGHLSQVVDFRVPGRIGAFHSPDGEDGVLHVVAVAKMLGKS